MRALPRHRPENRNILTTGERSLYKEFVTRAVSAHVGEGLRDGRGPGVCGGGVAARGLGRFRDVPGIVRLMDRVGDGEGERTSVDKGRLRRGL
jgi:hypothetical protein